MPYMIAVSLEMSDEPYFYRAHCLNGQTEWMKPDTI